jgi:MFS family permease
MAGQSISLTGSWIQQIAVVWLLYRLTHSTTWLGWLGFCEQISVAVFITVAGVLVDRFDRRRLLLTTQSLALAQALVLALLTWFHVIRPRDILMLTVFSGIIESIALPARQTLIPALLDGNDQLSDAIGLNLSLINITRFLGPMFAGLLVAASGEALCFLINGVSFLATIAALLMIRLPPRVERGPKIDFWVHWKEGLGYAYGHPAIRRILVMAMIASLVATPTMTLMPAVAQALAGGPKLLGALMSALGFGTIVGGLAITMVRGKSEGEVRNLIAWAAAGVAIANILFSLTRSIPVALCLSFTAGFSFTLIHLASNTWLQLTVPDMKRGRVMSLFSWAALGLVPVASLVAGFTAERIGIYPTIRIGACLGLAAVLFVALGWTGARTQAEMNPAADPHGTR